MNESQSHPQRNAVWLLGAIMLLGLLVRVYRLGEQSLWWDDYNGLAHLTMEGFVATMVEARRVNAEGAPLYHFVQYFAAFVIGSGEYAQRLFNVLIGVATIPVIFLAGRNSFGTRAGMLAALLFALSPPHIYHAQSLRAYPLAMLLAAVALLAIERLLATRQSRWVYLNAMANGAMCLTHYFGLFGVLAQGTAALFLIARKHPRLFVHWCIVQILCLLPAGLFVATMERRTDRDFWHFGLPAPRDLLKNLLGGDLTDFAVRRAPLPDTGAGYWLEHPWVAATMAVLMMALFAGVGCWALVRLLGPSRRGDTTPGAPGAQPIVLMLCYWVLPLAFLLAAAFLWRPVIYPRYTLYACLGLYLLAGPLFAGLRRPRMRLAMLGAIMVLYGYQLALLLPTDTRTQWRAVVTAIEQQIGPGDIILVGGNDRPEVITQTFWYHMPREWRTPVAVAHSTLDLLEQVRCHAIQHMDADPAPAVWFVLNSHYNRSVHGGPPRAEAAAQYLNANEVPFAVWHFPAEEGLALFRIPRWDGATPDGEIVRPAALANEPRHDYRADMEALGLDPDDEALLAAFERAYEDGVILQDPLEIAVTYAVAMADFGDFEHAFMVIEAFLAAADAGPEAGFYRWYWAMLKGDIEGALNAVLIEDPPDLFRLLIELALAVNGNTEIAQESYWEWREALHPNEVPALPLLDAAIEGDAAAFRDAAHAYRSAFRPHGDVLHRALLPVHGLDAWMSACRPPTAVVKASPGTVAAAEAALALYRE